MHLQLSTDQLFRFGKSQKHSTASPRPRVHGGVGWMLASPSGGCFKTILVRYWEGSRTEQVLSRGLLILRFYGIESVSPEKPLMGEALLFVICLVKS